MSQGQAASENQAGSQGQAVSQGQAMFQGQAVKTDKGRCSQCTLCISVVFSALFSFYDRLI